MPEVTFWPVGAAEPLCHIDALPGERLLDLACFHEIPLHWRCGQGTCGTCLVYLKHDAQPAILMPSAKERNVLARAGLIDAVKQGCPAWTDTGDTPRLACHCVVGQLPLTVHFVPR